jgi:hypothetical protein
MKQMTIFATPDYSGQFTLTDDRGNEVQEGYQYDSREAAMTAARQLWPDGRAVRNGWRIEIED